MPGQALQVLPKIICILQSPITKVNINTVSNVSTRKPNRIEIQEKVQNHFKLKLKKVNTCLQHMENINNMMIILINPHVYQG